MTTIFTIFLFTISYLLFTISYLLFYYFYYFQLNKMAFTRKKSFH